MRLHFLKATARLNSISIARLLAGFNVLAFLGFVAIMVLTGFALETLRIGGPMYDQIIVRKDLVAETMSPPLGVVDAYNEVTQIEKAPLESAPHIAALKRLRARYDERRAVWARSNLNEDTKRKLLIDSDREAGRFWGELENGYLPALMAGDARHRGESYGKLSGAYNAQREILDEIASAAALLSSEVEKQAQRRRGWIFAGMSLAATAILCLSLLALRVAQKRVTQPLVTLADHLKGGKANEGASSPPFLDRRDEIGVVARAIESFRCQVEQRVLEMKNAQLDAALDNIDQGLEMYEADGRLALCNVRYNTMYGLAADAPIVGMTLDEVVSLRVRAGVLARKAAIVHVRQILHALADETARDFVYQLADGRSIAVLVEPLRRGGFIVTHADVTAQRRSEEKIAFMASHDALTGLPNAALIEREIDKTLAYSLRGEIMAIHILDLDRFQSVNDLLGRKVGDTLLRCVADRLRREIRETDRLGRLGSDEFVIVERQISAPQDAVALANRLIEVVSEPYEIDGDRIALGASVGITVIPQDGATSKDLLRDAGLAIQRAKSEGGGKFCFFEPSMDAQMQARARTERELRAAVADNQFELHYQPIVEARTGTICSCEALVRWRHPTMGMVSPAVFITLAEETGLIGRIGEWVLREACAAAARWPAPIKVNVNLSAAQFAVSDIEKTVEEALEHSGLKPERLDLEITETLALDGETLETLHALRAKGVQISLDDFGTGYSSLSYLQSFPFDGIKIDRAFVQGMGDADGKSLKIVRAIATLARSLRIKTTAEGVETEAQLETVEAEGCTEIQGFLISKPLPLPELERFLQTRLAAAKSVA